jgi:mRNA interferase ChpB
VSKITYHPSRGDILHVNFAPSAGREFTGPHYGLVISTLAFSRGTGLCIVLPATSKYHADARLLNMPLMVKIPELPVFGKDGWLYIHQIKTIDYRERGATLVARVDDDFLIDVMDRTKAFIDPDTPG